MGDADRLRGWGVWFILIKWALWADLQAPSGSSVLREWSVFLLTREGVGLDPSYVTLVIPLITVPVVSYLTRSARGGDADVLRAAEFRERLGGSESEAR